MISPMEEAGKVGWAQALVHWLWNAFGKLEPTEMFLVERQDLGWSVLGRVPWMCIEAGLEKAERSAWLSQYT